MLRGFKNRVIIVNAIGGEVCEVCCSYSNITVNQDTDYGGSILQNEDVSKVNIEMNEVKIEISTNQKNFK
jgi:hypothetical protein